MENRSLKELYEKLVSKRQHEGKELPTVLIENRILGYPVYRGTTEGGEYDEVLYVTEEGTVVYGLVQNIPQHTHTCPYYETHGAEELISRCNNDGMNMLPKIEL